MIKIYHAKVTDDFNASLNFLLGFRPMVEAVEEQVLKGNIRYEHVADVDTHDMWRAFELTNNLDHSWITNHGVTVHAKHNGGLRSTSAGDVMVTVHADGTEVAKLLQGIGDTDIPTWSRWISK